MGDSTGQAGGTAKRLAEVRETIAAAARRAGRDPAAVTLVAVSKTHGPEAIRAAFAAGQLDFGENYTQELAAKRAALADLPGLRWHMIGHLQRNKVKLVVPGVHLLQTVDSPRLAEALDRRLAEHDGRLDVLVQVDVAGEEQKAGAAPDEVPALVDALRARPRLRLRGLMAIPPWTLDGEGSRPYFRALRELAGRLGLAPDERELSMGMSDSYAVAVEEGATLVRVGTAIFGPRA
ncbi:MAG: YggS family pyridoxal phosphate-dependent enzyme [Deltaproteobacteria bacterium]|nr:YggS family pyridoxal phosphate-dependent enzyme [Deltaproteobacteria bacterium]